MSKISILEKRLPESKGPFSGTNECECGGIVNYTLKRKDGAEIGTCKKCKRIYIDNKGNRLPSTYKGYSV